MYHPRQNQKNSQRKKKKTGIKLNAEDNYEEVDAIINHTQDSDAENSKVQKPTKKKTSPFDTIRDYFKAPFHAKPTDTVMFPSHYKYAHDLIPGLFNTRKAQVIAASSTSLEEHTTPVGNKSKSSNMN
ncbi:hypothetical protein PtA15_7A272 [Puccinia triticina]|uniref:Uncharacterized protein n=1 Tax=Puccinia triticina TaxID=208348 RepID=A0ABY7CQY8_9BASI|nr:uncharacterized protein PtA15_7A272 [Puccinia triticina]WAQ86546.1 hypothetical protein PtA15_7A272 [Puccinia triticina]